jgi:hypothetical protein
MMVRRLALSALALGVMVTSSSGLHDIQPASRLAAFKTSGHPAGITQPTYIPFGNYAAYATFKDAKGADFQIWVNDSYNDSVLGPLANPDPNAYYYVVDSAGACTTYGPGTPNYSIPVFEVFNLPVTSARLRAKTQQGALDIHWDVDPNAAPPVQVQYQNCVNPPSLTVLLTQAGRPAGVKWKLTPKDGSEPVNGTSSGELGFDASAA